LAVLVLVLVLVVVKLLLQALEWGWQQEAAIGHGRKRLCIRILTLGFTLVWIGHLNHRRLCFSIFNEFFWHSVHSLSLRPGEDDK
jgi:ABC-type iron transport system FetAB permease component